MIFEGVCYMKTECDMKVIYSRIKAAAALRGVPDCLTACLTDRLTD